MRLLKNVDCFAPRAIGKRDILVRELCVKARALEASGIPIQLFLKGNSASAMPHGHVS